MEIIEDEIIEITGPTIMSICTDMSRCGGSIYLDSRIELVADRKDVADPYKGLDLLIQKTNPKKVIVSSAQKKLIAFIEKRFNHDVEEIIKAPHNKGRVDKQPNMNQQQVATFDESVASQIRILEPELTLNIDQEPDFTLVIVPNFWFSVARGYQKLLDSEFVSRKGFTGIEEKSLFVSSKVEKSVDVCAIRSISAIDSYLSHTFRDGTRATESLFTATNQGSIHDELFSSSPSNTQISRSNMIQNNLFPILDIRYVDPGPVLSIDKFSAESLAIFKKGTQASNNDDNSSDSDPEALTIPSLYELLNQCQSFQGKKQLHTIMLWPLRDSTELRYRHDAVEYLKDPNNKLLVEEINMNMKNIVPLSRCLVNLSQSVASFKDLATIYKSIWAFISIIDQIKTREFHGIEIFNRIIALDTDELRKTVDTIMNVVDFEASKTEGYVQVCLGVDKSVDEKKEIINNLAKLCNEVGIQETTKYKNILRKMCRVIYIPRIGFLNSVEYTSHSDLLEIKANREFDVLLYTEQSIYFKTPKMEELDRNAGDIACDLVDVQQNVLIELQEKLLKLSDVILGLMELCGELDCLIAFATVANQRGYSKPELIESSDEFYIRQAYHPLHCITTNIVPNDIKFYKESAGRQSKIMIITGPNSCGKSTYMKTACLIVYMAQIGCFVPASEAKLPIMDAIFTRMNPANSISTGLSSFATDLHQINYALNRATEKSLIAIDEFGKGTQARDGFHLLKGLMMHFAIQGMDSPYVMATSHFSRLVDHLQVYSERIIYKTFKVTRNIERDVIIYEYTLKDGVGELTLADEVALKAGVQPYIIERAKQIRDHISEERPIGPRPPRAA